MDSVFYNCHINVAEEKNWNSSSWLNANLIKCFFIQLVTLIEIASINVIRQYPSNSNGKLLVIPLEISP